MVSFLVVFGAFLGQLTVSVLYALSNDDIMAVAIQHASLPKQWLLMLQAITASSAFVLAPLLYLQIFTQQGCRMLFQWRQSYVEPTWITLGLVLAFMGINARLIQWNKAVQLPTWLGKFEIWAKEREAALQKIADSLTSFDSLTELALGIVVMGIIPAVGEELLFRGLVQNLFHKLTKNIHLAIGISAFFFSAIHLQFYGLLPRFLLGVLFGYIYGWTQDLFFPMVAHFFNNFCVLLMFFLHQQETTTQDISFLQRLPISAFIFSTAVALTLGNRLRQQGRRT